MALNATVGAPDANSYVTVAEADAYFADRIHSDSWQTVDSPPSALVTASRLLDWYIKWKGHRSSTTQSMQWPRTGVSRPDGSSVDTTIIPSEVKTAVFELALSSLEADRTADSGLAGIEQVKVGSLMVKADNGDVDSTAASVIPEKVNKILSDLVSSGSLSVVRLMRA
jgi:hypothetical protein